MDYEKKYNKALEVASQWHKDGIGDVKNVVECIFPELCESEDEKIRNFLIKQANSVIDSMTDDDEEVPIWESALAWLEKQGKKLIPEDINEAALQYVDTCAVDGEVTHGNITEPYWNNHSMMNAYKAGWLEKQSEQILANSAKTCKNEQKPSWSEEDEEMHEKLLFLMEEENSIPSWGGCYEWLKSLKDRVQPQPKQEWSEEDEKMLKSCITILEQTSDVRNEWPLNKPEVDWLKSLKSRWKPTEEQMEHLNRCFTGRILPDADVLESLYNDLKSL